MLAMRVRDSRGGADPRGGYSGAHKPCTVNLGLRYGSCENDRPGPQRNSVNPRCDLTGTHTAEQHNGKNKILASNKKSPVFSDIASIII